MTDSLMKTLTIGKLAKSCKVKIDTVRYYEKVGLLIPVDRSESGYRVYDQSSVKQLRFIRKAQSLGFKLQETKDLLELSRDSEADCGDIRDTAKLKIKEIELKVQDLLRMKNGLAELAEYCPGKGKPLEDCGILAHFYQEEKELANE